MMAAAKLRTEWATLTHPTQRDHDLVTLLEHVEKITLTDVRQRKTARTRGE
jgi:hypothetical protein